MPVKKQPQAYEPYIKVGDISSLGRSHRVYGYKSGRTHHLLSDLELRVFLLFEWNANVISIKEQFPLNLKETLAIAEDANIKHPAIKGEKKVMTTDFYVTSNGKDKSITSQTAFQVKYAKDLDKPRTLEKIEIERRFWKSKDVPFYIITENEIPLTVSNNIEWLYPSKNFNRVTLSSDDLEYYSKQLKRHRNFSLINFCKKCDTLNNLEIGTALSYMRALLAQNLMSFDITKDFRKLLCSQIYIVEQ